MFSRRPGHRFNRGRIPAGGGASWISLLPGYSSELRLALDQGGPYDLESGDIVQWHDSSGFGNHATQSTPEQRPTPETAGFNSRASVRFQASASDHLIANGVASIASGEDKPFVVAELIEVVSGTGVSFAFTNAVDGDTVHRAETPSLTASGKLRMFRRQDSGVSAIARESTSDFPSGTLAIIYEFNGTEQRTYIDDASSAFTTMLTMDTGTLTTDVFTLGAQILGGTLGFPLDHRKATFLLWSGITGLDEAYGAGSRTTVMNTLKAKGGIS